MKLSTLLASYAVVAVVFCLGLLLAPAFWITLYGATADAQATLLVRSIGALFSGLAVMAWLGRHAEPSQLRDSMVLGLAVLNSVSAVAAVVAAISGVYNRLAWGPVAVYVVFAVAFLLVGRQSVSTAAPK